MKQITTTKSYLVENYFLYKPKIDARDGSSKLLTSWNSSKIMGGTGEGHLEQRSPPLIRTLEDLPPTSSGPAPPS
jgi:hypothetical protein